MSKSIKDNTEIPVQGKHRTERTKLMQEIVRQAYSVNLYVQIMQLKS